MIKPFNIACRYRDKVRGQFTSVGKTAWHSDHQQTQE